MFVTTLRPQGHLAAAALIVVVLLLALLLPATAAAHAVLLGASPEAEQQLDVSPSQLTLRFNENVGPIHFRVLDLAGEQVGEPGEIRAEGSNLHLPLNAELPNGTYVVTWRVVSADTHPVGGSYLFSIGEPLAAGAEIGAEQASGWTAVVVANRLLLYAAVILAIGSVGVLWLLALPTGAAALAQAQARWSAWLALFAYLLAIGAGGAEMLAADALALFTAAAWQAGIGTTLGASAFLGVPGALLLAWSCRRTVDVPALGIAGAGSLLLLLSFLVTGHAATAAPVWLMASMVAIHVLCAALWFGALAPLARVVRDTPAGQAASVMDQFSRVAVWSVAALFLSGVVISWVQVAEFNLLFNTSYGVRLLTKVGLFLALLALAARNKLRLTPRLARGSQAAQQALRRTIAVEYVLIVAILAVAVSLTVPVPPRALAEQDPMQMQTGTGSYSVTAQQRGFEVRAEVTPARPGENMVMLYFKGPDGESHRMVRATISASLPAASIEGIFKVGHAMGGGWHFDFTEFVIPGEWHLRIDGFIDDFDKLTFDATVQIR
jgi:copper transport protein